VLASYDASMINAATYAVTVEQAGGSPDGKPHSTPVYTGKADRDGAGRTALNFARKTLCPKRKRPWERAFFVSQLGVVGSSNTHVATLGGCKEPREFVQIPLAYDR